MNALRQMPSEIRGVRLDPVAPSDYASIAAIESPALVGPRWRHGASTPAPHEAVESLWTDVLEQRLLRRTDVARPEAVGLVTAYGANLRCGTAWLGVVGVPEIRNTGLAFFGLGLFIEQLFAHWPLRQLYAEVHEYNYGAFRSGEGTIFRQIGCLRQHTELYGTRWDLYMLMIDRDSWSSGPSQLLWRRLAREAHLRTAEEKDVDA